MAAAGKLHVSTTYLSHVLYALDQFHILVLCIIISTSMVLAGSVSAVASNIIRSLLMVIGSTLPTLFGYYLQYGTLS